MKQKQPTLRPITNDSPEKYSEHMAHEQGAIKSSTRRGFLAGASGSSNGGIIKCTSSTVRCTAVFTNNGAPDSSNRIRHAIEVRGGRHSKPH